jgi:hypothetical protein
MPLAIQTLSRPGSHERRQLARLPDLLSCTLLVVLCIGFFWPTLVGRVLLPADGLYLLDPVFAAERPAAVRPPINMDLVADLVGQIYPWRAYASRSLHHGSVPLWNPYSACGMPFLANDQSSVLSPANFLLSALLPPEQAQTLFALLTLLAACLFTYGLSRALGSAPVGGVLAGLTFGFGGFIFIWLGYPLAATAAWFPALLWATHTLMGRPTLPKAALVALIIGAQFLAGHLSTSVHMLGFWVIFVGYEAVARRHGARRRALALAGLALLLGSGLAAPQLLPTGEYFGLSTIRGKGRSRWAADSTGQSLRKGLLGDAWFLRNLAATEVGLLFAPELRGNPAFNDYRPTAGYGNYAERASYIGALALIALVAGALRLPVPGYRRFFTIAAWAFLAILLHLPVLNLTIYLPVLRFAAPQRLRFAFTLCASVVLALTVTGWLSASGRDKRRLRGALLAGGALVAALGAAGALLAWFHLASGLSRLGVGSAFVRSAKVFVPPTATVAAVGMLLRGRRSLVAGLVLVTVADLFTFAARWQPTARPEHVLPPVAMARRLGHARITGPPAVLRPDLAVAYGIYDTRAYDPMAVGRYVTLVEALHGATPGSRPWLVLGPQERLPALERLTSAAYTWRRGDDGVPALERISGSLPRAYIAARVRPSTSRQALIALAAGLDPSETTLTEGPSRPPQHVSRGPATIIADRPNHVMVRGTGPGLLVLTDVYYPGWRATVNGRAAGILPANYAFRGVEVSEGQSDVGFTYEPASYRIGLFLGLTSLAITLAIAGAALPLRRPWS